MRRSAASLLFAVGLAGVTPAFAQPAEGTEPAEPEVEAEEPEADDGDELDLDEVAPRPERTLEDQLVENSSKHPIGWIPQFVVPIAPKHRFFASSLSVMRLNPLGLETQLRVGYQRRLSTNPGVLTRDTYAFLGLAPKLNPAFAKFGPQIELQPLAIFNLKITGEFVGYFGGFGYLQSAESPTAEYADELLEAGKDAKTNYITNGVHVAIEPMVQIKLGKLAIRNKWSIEYWKMALDGDDSVFYDSTLDTLVPGDGWVLANDFDVLVVGTPSPHKGALTYGVRWSMVKPYYANDDFVIGDDQDDADNGHHRIGPLLAYTFYDRPFSTFNKPSILLIANWYLSHRYRTGDADSQIIPGKFGGGAAMPYVVLGFAFQSDLLDFGP
jgi:hypothetical protein